MLAAVVAAGCGSGNSTSSTSSAKPPPRGYVNPPRGDPTFINYQSPSGLVTVRVDGSLKSVYGIYVYNRPCNYAATNYQLRPNNNASPIAPDGSFSIPSSEGTGGWGRRRDAPNYDTNGPASGSGRFSADGANVTVSVGPHDWSNGGLDCTFSGQTMTLPKKVE
jgi:hypothetical protein